MKDTIIKNDGTSKTMKGSASIPETYEDFRQALIAGEINVDISLNEDGCDVVGTPLNKNSLLKSATAEKFGLDGEEATVNEVLEMLSIPQLYITSLDGSVMAVTKGGVSYEGVKVGNEYRFNLIDFGTYTVTATLEGISKTMNINIDTVKRYAIEFGCKTVFGISRDITSSSTSWTRTEDAVGKTFSASVGTTRGHSDFDNEVIYKDIVNRTNVGSDVFTKIPKFYYKRTRVMNIEEIQITDKPWQGFKIHPAFLRAGVEKDFIYVGSYKTSSNNKSVSGASPQVSQTRATMRNNARNKGAGYGIIDIATWNAIQMLMLVEVADNNVQAVIGEGWSASGHSGSKATGSCDAVPNLTGRPAGTSNDVDVVWRGIEGFWGNVWEWVDGININNGAYYICTDPTKYADDTTTNYTSLEYTGGTGWSTSYIQQEGYDEEIDWCMMPTTAGGGSATTYYADACWSASGWRVCQRGGDWNDGSSCGLFAVLFSGDSSSTGTGIGSRLLYIPS